MMLILALSRGLPYYMAAQRERRWDKEGRKSPLINLPESTVLIFGVGGIGAEVARMCHAFGMRVVGVEPRPEHDLPFVEMHSPDELDGLLPDADFVVATTPVTPDTEGVWNAAKFKLMKSTAYLINIGRGRTMKIDDLADAIENGEIAGCGLDVFEVEPLPADHRLWGLENVILTPHIAVRDAENLPERRYQVIIENARRFLAGEPLMNIVDKENWY
jgi:phosphoglycerate dehydrogenase-like enzyme